MSTNSNFAQVPSCEASHAADGGPVPPLTPSWLVRGPVPLMTPSWSEKGWPRCSCTGNGSRPRPSSNQVLCPWPVSIICCDDSSSHAALEIIEHKTLLKGWIALAFAALLIAASLFMASSFNICAKLR